MVYVKRFLRRFGIDKKFNWPNSMISVSSLYHSTAEWKFNIKYLSIQEIEHVVTGRKCGIFAGRPDLLGHLIEEGKKPDTGVKMGTIDVVDQMSEILLAGSETTSGTIASFFLEIARNEEVKAKLLRSLPARSPSDPLIDAKTIRSDPQYAYFEACLKETLRLHPIASEMGRTTGKKRVQIAGHTLPPHTIVSVSYRNLHVDPEFWPEPKRFWPERWLEPDHELATGAPPPEYAFSSPRPRPFHKIQLKS